MPVGTLRAVASPSVTTLPTTSLATEILQECLLTLEQVTRSITVLGINASTHPEHSVRIRALLSDLLELVQDCDGDLGANGP